MKAKIVRDSTTQPRLQTAHSFFSVGSFYDRKRNWFGVDALATDVCGPGNGWTAKLLGARRLIENRGY